MTEAHYEKIAALAMADRPGPAIRLTINARLLRRARESGDIDAAIRLACACENAAQACFWPEMVKEVMREMGQKGGRKKKDITAPTVRPLTVAIIVAERQIRDQGYAAYFGCGYQAEECPAPMGTSSSDEHDDYEPVGGPIIRDDSRHRPANYDPPAKAILNHLRDHGRDLLEDFEIICDDDAEVIRIIDAHTGKSAGKVCKYSSFPAQVSYVRKVTREFLKQKRFLRETY